MLILLSPTALFAKEVTVENIISEKEMANDIAPENTTFDKVKPRNTTFENTAPTSELRNISYSDTQKQVFSEPQQTLQYGADDSQFIHYWAPQQHSIKNGKAVKSPVILIHGGCWLSAFNIRHTYPQATALARAGHPVFNIEYRRTGSTGGGWPTTFTDITVALFKIRSVLEQRTGEDGFTYSANIVDSADSANNSDAVSSYKHQDKNQNSIQIINILGHSAGGHLALLAAAQSADIWPQDWQIHVFGLAAIVNIKDYAQGTNSCQSVTRDFMQGLPAGKPGAYYLANPKEHVLQAPQLSSVTLLHGSVDNIVPREQANHPDAKTVLIGNVGHFDWLHGQSVAFTHLLTLLK